MKLRSLLTLMLGAVMAAGLCVLLVLFQSGLQSYSDSTSEQAVSVRTNALNVFLSRALFEEWQRVERAADRLSGNFDPLLADTIIAGLEQDIDKVSWIGIADRNGTVLASSEDMLKGENVAQRPWFQQGLAGPFAGDVHEAVLLAKLLETDNADPIRFVDFSSPIRNEQGQVIGVLGAHVNWRWVEELVDEAASALQLHAFIINRGGTVVLQTDVVAGDLSTLRSFRSAALGVVSTDNEVWPDGQTYFASAVPQFSYGSLPPFGWSMVARLDPGFAEDAKNRFGIEMLAFGIAVFVLMLVLFGVIAAILLRPMLSLVTNLQQLAHGQATPFVREHRRFKEATILSDAVVLLQSRSAHSSEQSSPNGTGNNAPQ